MCETLKAATHYVCRTCGCVALTSGKVLGHGNVTKLCFDGHSFVTFWELSKMTKGARKNVHRWLVESPEGIEYAETHELPESLLERAEPSRT